MLKLENLFHNLTPQYIYLLFFIIRQRLFGQVIVFLAPPPLTTTDGYFVRVKQIDKHYKGYLKIYLTHEQCSAYFSINKIKKNTFHVSFFPLSKLQKLQAILILFFGRSIYAHALDWFRPFANQSKGINKFYHLSWDVHGVVPEEMVLLKDPRVEEFEELEKIIAHTAHEVVCVTIKLKEHLQNKYPTINPNWQIVPMRVNLPTISPKVLKMKKKLAKNELPTVIYAGGLQPWQLVEEMQAFVVKHLKKANWIFCVPDPTAFWQTFPLKRNQLFCKNIHYLLMPIY